MKKASEDMAMRERLANEVERLQKLSMESKIDANEKDGLKADLDTEVNNVDPEINKIDPESTQSLNKSTKPKTPMLGIRSSSLKIPKRTHQPNQSTETSTHQESPNHLKTPPIPDLLPKYPNQQTPAIHLDLLKHRLHSTPVSSLTLTLKPPTHNGYPNKIHSDLPSTSQEPISPSTNNQFNSKPLTNKWVTRIEINDQEPTRISIDPE